MKHQFTAFSPNAKYFIGLLFALFISTAYTQDDIPVFEHFDEWPIVKLNGGILACSEYHTEFEDNFNTFDGNKWNKYMDNNPYHRFHCGAPAAIFTDDNVTISNNDYLMLTVKAVNPAYRLQDPNHIPSDYDCFQDVDYVERNATAGIVEMKGQHYNLGKYEIRCKFPNSGSAWSAFWMWHHHEIDIFDIAFRGGFGQGLSRNKKSPTDDSEGRYSTQITNSPCCPHFSNCDFCSTNGITCTSNGCSSDCDPINDIYNCEYMANSFHVVGCEWTPFRISFYVDGTTIGTVYKYYNFDKTGINVECGENIPEGLVRENPVFTMIYGTGFHPRIWITANPEHYVTLPNPTVDCDFEGCDASNPGTFPDTLLVDYVKIEERIYEQVNLIPDDCYILCNNHETPVCVDLNTTFINHIYEGNWNWPWTNYVPDVAESVSWNISTNNATLTEEEIYNACFTYNGTNSVILSADVVIQPSGETLNISKTLNPIEPKIYYDILDDGTIILCVDKNDYCDEIQTSINGDELDTEEEDITCYSAPCIEDFSISYSRCGFTKSISESCDLFDVSLDEVDACAGYTLIKIENFSYQSFTVKDAYLLDGGNNPVEVDFEWISSDELEFNFEGEYLIYSLHFTLEVAGGVIPLCCIYDFEIPVCDDCCPPGSAFDGVNCYFGIHFSGVTGFVLNNSFYTTPSTVMYLDNFGCPPGSVFDTRNCYFGIYFPGYEGFVYNNSFYTHTNCDPEFQGENGYNIEYRSTKPGPLQNQIDILIYPSPFFDNFDIMLLKEKWEECSVIIYSIIGEKLFESHHKFEAGNKINIIPNVPTGIYLVNIELDKKSYIYKAIKM